MQKQGLKDVLNAPMGPNDADAATIGEYFKVLAVTAWYEGEGFSGKRPFGNSGWENDVYSALAYAGFISGVKNTEDPDYTYWESYDETTGNRIIQEALQAATLLVVLDA